MVGNPLPASHTDPAAIALFLQDMQPLLDIDGNGQTSVMTDGLLLVRYLFGFRGSSLIEDVVGPGATRHTSDAIEAALQALRP